MKSVLHEMQMASQPNCPDIQRRMEEFVTVLSSEVMRVIGHYRCKPIIDLGITESVPASFSKATKLR